jgi:hypothetical protein
MGFWDEYGFGQGYKQYYNQYWKNRWNRGTYSYSYKKKPLSREDMQKNSNKWIEKSLRNNIILIEPDVRIKFMHMMAIAGDKEIFAELIIEEEYGYLVVKDALIPYQTVSGAHFESDDEQVGKWMYEMQFVDNDPKKDENGKAQGERREVDEVNEITRRMLGRFHSHNSVHSSGVPSPSGTDTDDMLEHVEGRKYWVEIIGTFTGFSGRVAINYPRSMLKCEVVEKWWTGIDETIRKANNKVQTKGYDYQSKWSKDDDKKDKDKKDKDKKDKKDDTKVIYSKSSYIELDEKPENYPVIIAERGNGMVCLQKHEKMYHWVHKDNLTDEEKKLYDSFLKAITEQRSKKNKKDDNKEEITDIVKVNSLDEWRLQPLYKCPLWDLHCGSRMCCLQCNQYETCSYGKKCLLGVDSCRFIKMHLQGIEPLEQLSSIDLGAEYKREEAMSNITGTIEDYLNVEYEAGFVDLGDDCILLEWLPDDPICLPKGCLSKDIIDAFSKAFKIITDEKEEKILVEVYEDDFIDFGIYTKETNTWIESIIDRLQREYPSEYRSFRNILDNNGIDDSLSYRQTVKDGVFEEEPLPRTVNYLYACKIYSIDHNDDLLERDYMQKTLTEKIVNDIDELSQEDVEKESDKKLNIEVED